MRVPTTILCAIALSAASCAPRDTDRPSAPAAEAPQASPAPPVWVLTPDHFGPVRIGDTIAALRAALNSEAGTAGTQDSACSYVRPPAFPEGASAMVEGDRVVRIDVTTPGVLTPERAGVGDTEARLLTLYGARASVTPHKYTGPTGHYVTVTHPRDSTRLTVFETDGQVVLRYRAGLKPAVEYVEGCG